MEEVLAYFREAIRERFSTTQWDAWWSANEERLRTVFPKIEFLRLKARGLKAAEEYLTRTKQHLEPIQLDSGFLDELRAIPWFENCGAPLPCDVSGVAIAESISEAIRFALSEEAKSVDLWETIGYFNFIGGNAPEVHRRWNDRAYMVNHQVDRSGLIEIWEGRLDPRLESRADLISHIRADIVHLWMRHEHRGIVGSPVALADKLYWYRAGRIVCGWSGTATSGSLRVY